MAEIKSLMPNFPQTHSQVNEIWELELDCYKKVMNRKWVKSDKVQRYLQYTYMVKIKGLMPNFPQIHSQFNEIRQLELDWY